MSSITQFCTVNLSEYPLQISQRFIYLLAFGFYGCYQLLRGAGVNWVGAIGIHCFQVVVLCLDFASGDGPTSFAVLAIREQLEEFVEVRECQRLSLGDLDGGQIVVPDFVGGLSLVKED